MTNASTETISNTIFNFFMNFSYFVPMLSKGEFY
jgi:hypothetical protein